VSLQSYRRKRRFDRTPEPQPEGSVKLGARPLFVVQLHHASRRHYDVRLQVGDVLKSWACPKGPSYDPEVKRLAVEVEDHPVSYAAFEGDIPDGYGAGHVDLFDTGVWATSGDAEAQLQKGHLRFELFGERLRGGWHLVRSHRKERQPAWFLIKDKDGFVADIEADDLLDKAMVASTVKAAGRSGGAADVAEKLKQSPRKKPVSKRKSKRASAAKLAAGVEGARAAKPNGAFFEPELAVLRDSPPVGERWLHEVKWDGYRILTTIENGQVRLWSRNAKPWEDKIPDIRQAIEALGLQSAQLDGELIALTGGQPDFNALQRTLSGEAASPLAYVLFDMPYLEGFDLSRSPLVARKQALSELLGETPPVHLSYSSHLVGNGEDAFRAASEQHLEGIMCKRVDAPYRGGRGDNWVKVKRLESDEFAVVGYTDAKGSRTGFGSLLLAKPRDGGWYYIGRVGTGFNTAMLGALRKKLDAQKRAKKDIEHTSDAPRDAHWIEPTMVAEVFYRGIGNQGLLRQPSLKTMREDKSPRDLLSSDRDAPPARAASSGRKRSSTTKAAAITITHPDRVVYPADGYTKQDVADYYKTVMDWFLPGVLGRPTSTIRYPEGIDEPSFFQKHIPTGGLKHVGSARLKEETGAAAVYIYPENTDSIMELVQYNAIEFHPWGAHVTTPDIADRVIFDLDPGPDVAWARVIAAALLTRKLLQDLELESFVRTTGGKGLHVVVPLNPGSEWPLVKEFAQGFASAMAGAHPLDFTATSTKTLRNKKIYVDYLRNDRGATAVASYSLRGRPGAPVAVPLRWEELGKIKGGNQFDIKSSPARLKRLRKDPWDGIDKVHQDLHSVLQRLGGTR
jgi:bifunctional non-homologous end joining protein LigD